MRFPQEALEAAQRLSPAARRWLEHVEEHPELLRRSAFCEATAAARRVIPAFVGFAAEDPTVLQRWPVLLTPQRRQELADSVIALARLVRAIPQRFFGGDAAAVARFYGLQSEMLATLLLSQPTGIEESLCRADMIDTPKGLRCVELNFGNASGWQDNCVAAAYAGRPPLADWARTRGIPLTQEDSARALIRWAVRCCAESANGSLNLAVVAATRGIFSLDNHPVALYQEHFREALEEMGPELSGQLHVVGTDSLEFRGVDLHVAGDRIDGAIEQLDEVSRRDLFRAFKAGRLKLFSSPVGPLILGDKRNLALLSENPDKLTPEERRAVERWIPWTRLLKRSTVRFEGRDVELPGFLLEDRHRWVIKAAVAVGGESVSLGRDHDAGAWQATLEKALAEGGWIVQEMFETPGYPFQHGEEGWAYHRLVWGPFVFGDDYGGVFVRMMPTDQGRVVNLSQGGQVGLAYVTP